MSKKLYIGTIKELEGRLPLAFEVEEYRVALFKLADNNYYAIDDLCTHEDASLADGSIDSEIVSCPLHGAQFNIKNGTSLSLPALTSVKSYPVVVEDGKIYITVEK
ncbi:MAG: non-heme iron oxygenase ferredoxin subunit [Calditrichia bacterium]|nr:non-heme iron oxygenase ferredoxin subunit [Calditrichia bacterium]